MKTLIIASIYDYSGKTMVSLGVGKRLQADGYKVGYMTPLGRYPIMVDDVLVDSDAAFMSGVLQLDDPLEIVSPTMITQEIISRAYRGEHLGLEERIIHAHDEFSKSKDVLIMGWSGTINQGNLIGVSIKELVDRLDARVIVLYKCQGEVFVDELLPLVDFFRDKMAGVVINQLEFNAIERVKNGVAPFLASRGLNVLGIFLSDPIVMSVTVEELAAALDGEILCCKHKMDELIEQFSVGAMSSENAIIHFREIKGKAVITCGDRSNIQIAALEAEAKCIILTGNIYPDEAVIAKANKQKVPVILVGADSISTIRQIEDIMGTLRIRDERKANRAIELVNKELDFPLLYECLDLKAYSKAAS